MSADADHGAVRDLADLSPRAPGSRRRSRSASGRSVLGADARQVVAEVGQRVALRR